MPVLPQSNQPSTTLPKIMVTATPLPEAINPELIASFDSYANALDQALAEIDAQTFAKIAMLAYLASHHERFESKPPNPETPPAQTTQQPYDPSEWYYDPQTGTVYNPTTQEAFNPTTGEPMPMPEEFFIEF